MYHVDRVNLSTRLFISSLKAPRTIQLSLSVLPHLGIFSQGLLGVFIILIQMNSAKFSTIIPERPKEELQVQCESKVLSSIFTGSFSS